jgi:hypothetical protein
MSDLLNSVFAGTFRATICDSDKYFRYDVDSYTVILCVGCYIIALRVNLVVRFAKFGVFT